MALQGKIIAITGAASGIGLTASRTLAAAGATLLMADADAPKLDAAVKAVNAVRPCAQGVPTDVTKPAQLEALVEAARKAHGRLDVFINNAGVLVTGPFDAISDEDTTRQIEVNLLGVIYGTRAAARLMRQQGSGHIVNIASLAGLSIVPGGAAYAASKFGVRGYTHSAGYEMRDTGVQMTVICPDAVETPLLDGPKKDGSSPIIFSGTMLTPQRVADTIVKVIEKPRPEVAIPASRGLLAKFGMLFPRTADWLLSSFERKGRANLGQRDRASS